MRSKWHDADKLMPKSEQVVVGIWEGLTYISVDLCYYDKTTHEWFSASQDGTAYAISKPDYWIERPYD